MGLTAVQFWQQLESSGLMTSEESRRLVGDMTSDLSPDQMLDATAVANWLVKQKKLTSYQARIALGQKSGPLKCGGYLVQAEVADSTLPNWYRTIHSETKADYWMFAIPESFFGNEQFIANPPSIQLARAHARVQDSLLSALSEPQVSQGFLCVASNVLVGRSLLSTMQGVAMPVATARTIIIQAAMALDRLHEAGLVHGDLGLHSIWWDGDQSICLARDPLFLPQNPMAEAQRLAAIQVSHEHRLRYAAPEFTAPGQPPNVATDLYALGCLWYELLTGQPLIGEHDAVAMIKAILSSPRSSLTVDGFDKNSQRLLDHLIAKNPARRFSSARQFLQAMQVAKSPATAKTEQVTPQVSNEASSAAEANQTPTKASNKAEDKNRAHAKGAAMVPETPRNAWSGAPNEEVRRPAEQIVAPKKSKDASATNEKLAAATEPTLSKAIADGFTAKKPAKVDLIDEGKMAKPAKPLEADAEPAPKQLDSPSVKPTVAVAPGATKTPATKAPAAVETKNAAKPSSPGPVPAAAVLNATEAVQAPKSPKIALETPKAVPEGIASPSPAKVPDAKSDPLQTAAPKVSQPAAVTVPELVPKTSGDAKVETAKSSNDSPKIAAKPVAAKKTAKKAVGRKAKKPVWFLPVAGVASVLLVGGLAFALMSSKETTIVKPKPVLKPSQTDSSDGSMTDSSTAVKPNAEPVKLDPVATEYTMVKDDSLTLWAPPYVTDPIKLNMLPPGLQGVLHLNTAKIAKQPDYSTLHEVMGTAYQPLSNSLVANLPVPWTDCKSITIGLYASAASEWPDQVVRVELVEPKPIEELFAKYQFTTPSEELKFGADAYQRNSNAAIALMLEVNKSDPATSQRLIVGVPKLIQELVAVEGAIAPLTRQLEVLRQSSCTENDITYFTSTSLLLSSGRGVLQNSLAALLPYLRIQMQEEVAAIGLASNLDKLWYGEFRIVGKDAQSAPAIQTKWKGIWAALPEQSESALTAFSSNPYWAKVAFRLPQQLRVWQDSLRTGIELEHAVANFYLPNKAAPNLAFASWMALRAPFQPTTVASAPTESAAKPLTMDEILKVPVTIGFDQESLEAGAKEIANSFNASLNNPLSAIQIEIDGAALEKDGITRNQQIRDFRHDNKPFREVLISLVRKANPVTTVQSPNEKDQKLVWIVKDIDQRIIQVTTRTAAGAAGLTLPEEFVLPDSK